MLPSRLDRFADRVVPGTGASSRPGTVLNERAASLSWRMSHRVTTSRNKGIFLEKLDEDAKRASWAPGARPDVHELIGERSEGVRLSGYPSLPDKHLADALETRRRGTALHFEEDHFAGYTVKPARVVPLAAILGVPDEAIAGLRAKAAGEAHTAPLHPQERRLLAVAESLEQRAAAEAKHLALQAKRAERARDAYHPAGALAVDALDNADSSSAAVRAASEARATAAERAATRQAIRRAMAAQHLSGEARRGYEALKHTTGTADGVSALDLPTRIPASDVASATAVAAVGVGGASDPWSRPESALESGTHAAWPSQHVLAAAAAGARGDADSSATSSGAAAGSGATPTPLRAASAAAIPSATAAAGVMPPLGLSGRLRPVSAPATALSATSSSVIPMDPLASTQRDGTLYLDGYYQKHQSHLHDGIRTGRVLDGTAAKELLIPAARTSAIVRNSTRGRDVDIITGCRINRSIIAAGAVPLRGVLTAPDGSNPSVPSRSRPATAAAAAGCSDLSRLGPLAGSAPPPPVAPRTGGRVP